MRLKKLMPKILRPLFEARDDGCDMIPPKSMSFVGKGDFVKIGREFRRHFIGLAGLRPEHRVLDVGCGIGRMAIPLTEYLSPAGGYWGFDIVRKGIDWCQERITPKFPNFHFQHSDVYNRHYNPGGKVRACDYRFPFEDDFFDFVFLTSVFTHMVPADLENYLREIARVLKPGGKCLITFLLMNEESRALIRAKKSDLEFVHEMDGYFTTKPNDPEAAIAYDEKIALQFFERCGLAVEPPLRYGSWCGRKQYLSYQDIVVAGKGRTA
jgi:ubiquinone/menaquinone biosynthesis C-methylase UbiE